MPTLHANPDRMTRTAFVSLSSGIIFVLATLVAVALSNLPNSAVAEGASPRCPLAEVPLDPGYGVSGMTLQPVCGGPIAQASRPISVAK